MALKDLTVLLDPSEQSKSRLTLAAMLAGRHGAHLTGLCLAESVRPNPILLTGDAFAYGGALESFYEQVAAERAALISPVEAGFMDRLARDGISGEWVADDGPPTIASLARARLADLVIAGQDPPAEAEQPSYAAPIEELLLDSGRPLLLIPYYGSFPTCGDTILVGWTDTREAVRALHDAMPLLAAARSVTVLAVDPEHDEPGTRDIPTADVARHLARHGAKAIAAETVTGTISTADALLDYASDIGADLIVVGGYGHARVRELVIGGVTRSLLRHMTVPILFSH